MKQTRKQLIAEYESSNEQLRVQLAGCGMAALGIIKGKSLAKKGDYGWSLAYQDVVKLRKRLNAERRKVKKYETQS